MEQKIWDYFDSERMPEDCARRIEDAMDYPRRKSKGSNPLLRLASAPAVVALIVGLFITTDLMEVCADVLDFSIHTQNPKETRPLGEITADVYVSYGGSIVEESRNSISAIITVGIDVPAEVRNGRLYFIANGEDIDITDQCSMEVAYVYTMQDKTGINHYIFVGGTPENWGYGSIMYNPIKGNWIGGGGHNHCGSESNWEVYEWFRDAIEKIGCPFPV